MDFNFNDHTDEGTDPRPTWAAGMAAAGEDWENPTISPVTWTWTATATNMDVGFYHVSGSTGYVGHTEIYRTTAAGDFNGFCNESMAVEFARVRLNKGLIDGTPPWFFNAVVRHELGHVFGLCDAKATSPAFDRKKSVMFPPDPNDIVGCSGPPFSYQTCYPLPTSAVNPTAMWGTNPPSSLDFGDEACANPIPPPASKIEGVRCVYGV